MLGEQLGQILFDLGKPLGGGTQAGEMSEMPNRLVRQMMAFVKDIECVARIGQHRPTAQREVCEHHVMIGDDDVNLGHAFARLIECALLEVGAVAPGALTVISGQARPVGISQLFRPTVAITIPAVACELLDHASEELFAPLVHIDAKALFFEQLSGCALRLAFLQQRVELGQAKITTAPLGQSKGKAQAAIAHQIWQILVHDLFLQRDRSRCDHQALARRFGRRNDSQAIGDRLAGAGACLHRDDGGFPIAPPLIVGLNRAEHLRHFGDHQTLAISGLKTLGFEKLGVGALDLGLEFSAEHGRGGCIYFQYFWRVAMITRVSSTATGDFP